jgi:hypothetical protein
MQNHLKIRTAGASLSVYAAILICALACSGGGGESGGVTTPPPPPPPPPTGSVVGTVRHAANNTAIAGAAVSIGSVHTSTGADGTFTLSNVPSGPAVIRCTSPGLADYTSNVTVAAGTTTHDIRLAVQEVFELMGGTFSLFVPASVTAVRGIIVAHGGADTRPFADPRRSFNLEPDVPPELQSELMALGTDYRLLAARERLAVLGVSNAILPRFDVILFAALEEGAVAASRQELATAPLLIHAISSGTPAAAQLTAQNPSRVAGLVLRVPLSVSAQLSPESGTVPTYVITAELDETVDNNITMATYQQVRATGGLWAFAEEPRTPHRSHSASQRLLILEWFTAILSLREPITPGGPLRAIAEESGWLGAPVTLVVASWADFVGNRSAASWFPTQATAVRWQGFTRK